ncbi:MAG: glycosyltransferase family 4 protein [Thermoanaerobaculia bacterium]
MRFGLEGGSWANPRGYGRYLRSLHRALVSRGRHEWVLVLDSETAESSPAPRDAPVVVVESRFSAASGAAANRSRSMGDMFRMSRALARARFDALLFPSPHTYVPVRRAREIIVLHDVTAERFPSLVFESRAAARRWRWKTRTAVRRARRILTVSEHSRRGIAEIYRVDPARITVAPEAADPVFFEPPGPSGRPRPYFLFVGGLSPHKNLPLLLDAFSGVSGADLVLAGPFGTDLFHRGDLAGELRSGNLEERVVFAGDLADEKLRDLYAGALALVLPSLDEGFGLPAVEAAAAGTAVIVSRSTAPAEFLGDAALTFDPRDARELTRLLELVRDNAAVRLDLARRARETVRLLSWEEAAKRVERAAEEAAS